MQRARKSKRRWDAKNFWLLTMVMPGAIWLLLIRYLPMLGVIISFKDYKAQKPNTFWNNLIKSKWVGLDIFKFLKSPATATRTNTQKSGECLIATQSYAYGYEYSADVLDRGIEVAFVPCTEPYVDTTAAQYALALDAGALDPETTLPDYLAALDAAGMPDLPGRRQRPAGRLHGREVIGFIEQNRPGPRVRAGLTLQVTIQSEKLEFDGLTPREKG